MTEICENATENPVLQDLCIFLEFETVKYIFWEHKRNYL